MRPGLTFPEEPRRHLGPHRVTPKRSRKAGMAGVKECQQAGEPRRANGVQKAHPDAGALPFRHDDQAAGPRLDEALTRRERDVSDRFVADEPDVTGRGDHLRRFQIVMRLKIRPPSPVGFDDPQLDWRTSLKPPPGKAAGAGIENPVRLQPIQNVIVAGQDDDLAAGAAPSFREGVSADLGNLPVRPRW